MAKQKSLACTHFLYPKKLDLANKQEESQSNNINNDQPNNFYESTTQQSSSSAGSHISNTNTIDSPPDNIVASNHQHLSLPPYIIDITTTVTDNHQQFTETENSTSHQSSSTTQSSSESTSTPQRRKGGRPKGTTDLIYASKLSTYEAAKNEITVSYATEYNCRTDRSLTRRMVFDECYERIKTKRNLDDTFKYSIHTTNSRIKRTRLCGEGNDSPLLCIEQHIVSLLICMSKLKHSLKTSESIKLINVLINATDHQTRLIDWKKKHLKEGEYNSESIGKIGRRYWRSFLKRKRNKTRTKKGKNTT